jgi:hypothetical protein
MSATTGPNEAQIASATYDRMLEETRKFTAEQHKLMAEADKLRAEERKLGRDRLLAPWLAIVGLIGGILTIASTIARWKGWGGWGG